MAVDPQDFKSTLRRWASGVTVVTARAEERRHGMTATAFASVSVDPPLVLVCVNRESTTFQIIDEGQTFAVNVLAEGQDRISNHFASSLTDPDRFTGISWHEGEMGLPLIDGALATLECKVVRHHDEGTHRVFIGHVEHAITADGAPLLYYDGGYRELD